MALPKQVQAQVDALERYEQQVRDAQATEPKPDETPNSEPPEAAPETQSQATTPPEPPKPVVEDDNSPTWKQRYLSLQGQYNTQVPALQQQVQELKDSMSQMARKLEEAPAHPAQTAQPASDLVTKNDVETFGEDLVDLARRIAKDEFGKRESSYRQEIQQLQSQLAEAKGQVGEVVQNQAKTAEERFFDGLSNAIPTWEAVQATEECQAWLRTRIPGTGATWNQALNDAAARHDLSAVVELFETFFERHPALNPKAPPPTAPAANRELQRQVAPGKASTATAATPQARIYSARDYEMESMRQLRLLQAGKVEEAGRLEAELNAALAENRIRP
jgi:uncharacterized protein YukE